MARRFDGKVFTFTQPDGSTDPTARLWRSELRGLRDPRRLHRHEEPGDRLLRGGAVERRRQRPASRPPGPAARSTARVPELPRGLRVRRESAMAAARESALRTAGRRCDQRREERRQQLRAIRAMAAAGGPLLAPPQRQTVGDFVGLCLLIDFSDSPATIARDEVERFCNQPGYNGFGNHGSVFDFFHDNSIGRCRYTNVVAPYYRALHPKTYYTNAPSRSRSAPTS